MRILFIIGNLLIRAILDHCPDLTLGNGFSLSENGTEIFLSKPTGQKDQDGKAIYAIYSSHNKGNATWSQPEKVSFSKEGIIEYHPELNHDESRIYYISRRPEPGSTSPVPYANLWYVEKNGSGWSDPVFLEEINHQGQDSYPSFAADGTLYFNSDRPGGRGSMDIYSSELVDGKYQKPELLAVINSADSENDLVIHPEKKWIIFNRYSFETGELDLFISFKEGTGWRSPEPLDLINRPGVFELTPSLSPDLKTFYYEVNGKLQCVALDTLLKSLRH